MRELASLFLVLSITSNLLVAQQLATDFPKLTGPYLGQKPPGMTPEIFAERIITTEFHEHSSPAFSLDGKEVYWSVFINFWGPQVILFMKQKNGMWTQPEVASFSGQYTDGNPCLTKDGKKLFFESSRPLTEDGEYTSDMDLWFVERTETSWGKPQHIGFKVNSNKWERGPSISDNGNLYFASLRDGGYGKFDIYVSKFIDNSYSEPENIGPMVNTAGNECWTFIAPDESYIMYESDSREIFISYRVNGNSWSKPVSTAVLLKTSNSQDRFPKLSNDGKYLFFVSSRRNGNPYFDKPLSLEEIKNEASAIFNGMGNVYWVDAKIIDALKPKELK